MSDKLGSLGQKYEERKTKKVGVLADRDSERKKLIMLDDKMEKFEISYASFKSNWRKVVDDSVEQAAETTVSEEETTNSTDVVESVSEMTVETLANEISNARPDETIKFTFDDGTFALYSDGVLVVKIHQIGNDVCKVSMLPDVFTYADWHDAISIKDVMFNCKLGKHSYVVVNVFNGSVVDALNCVKSSITDLNLYGYTED